MGLRVDYFISTL